MRNRHPNLRRALTRLLPMALLAIGLSACDIVEPTGPLANEQAQLTAARKLWRSQSLNDYTYVFARGCFCVPEVREPATITVRGGTVTSVVGVANGVPRDRTQYHSIDGLFDLLQEAILDGAATVRVEYDPARGYPTSAYVDRDQRIADEEFSIEARSLAPLR